MAGKEFTGEGHSTFVDLLDLSLAWESEESTRVDSYVIHQVGMLLQLSECLL